MLVDINLIKNEVCSIYNIKESWSRGLLNICYIIMFVSGLLIFGLISLQYNYFNLQLFCK